MLPLRGKLTRSVCTLRPELTTRGRKTRIGHSAQIDSVRLDILEHP